MSPIPSAVQRLSNYLLANPTSCCKPLLSANDGALKFQAKRNMFWQVVFTTGFIFEKKNLNQFKKLIKLSR
jgi:hypothetical protein